MDYSNLPDEVRNLVCTSVEDCKSSLQFVNSLPILEGAIQALGSGQKTKRALMERRIRELRLGLVRRSGGEEVMTVLAPQIVTSRPK
jgi:hypothetical protein